MFRQMFEEKYMRFLDGKSKALTFSYDDGVKADKRLVAVFDKYGLKGTFNLNSRLFGCENWHGRLDEEETYSLFANNRHEVALHGARHIFLDKVPLAEAVNEIVQNRVYLENKFGRIVRGLAYAYNGYNDEVINALKCCGVSYARTTESSYGFSVPTDWYRLKPTCHHADARFYGLADKFLNCAPEQDFKHREPWLFYIWGHSYEFDDGNNWDIIESFAKRVSGRKDIWFATNSEVYNYVQAYKNLVFSIDGERVYNPSHMPVWIEIRGKVYKAEGGATLQFDKEV